MEQRHSTRNIIIIAVISLFVFLTMSVLPSENNEEVLHEDASTISIQQAEEIAMQFVNEQFDVDLNQVEILLTFQTNKQLSGYLQKNKLVSEYNELYGESIPIDYFQVQISNHDVLEKYLVNIDMISGKIISWKMNAKATMTDDAKQKIAELFIAEQGYNIDNFYLLPQSDYELSNYIYESYDGGIKDAKLQLHLTIMQDEVKSFESNFVLPDSFISWMEEQDFKAAIMSWLSIGFNILFGIIALIIAIVLRKRISFIKGIWLTLIFLIIYTITNINMYPVYRAMSPIEISNFNAVFIVCISILIYLILSIILYLTSVAADGLWNNKSKALWPNRKDLSYGQHALKAMGFGYLFAIIILAVQSIFYFIGETFFDVWSASDPSFSPYNFLMPGLMPLIAWAAAISEEIIYRWFGIPLFQKIFRSTIIAVFITSMIWAIGHTAYPIYPAYTRFIEVTIIGLIFGYIFLKFGFMTAVFAHAIVDSILFSLQLLYLDFTKYAFLSLFYIVLPAIVAYIMFKFHHRFKRNRPAPVEEPT
ncbi:CPBP family intramembrane glutamic endopeptidase [Chengkuizengella axinellae]|uniref:CPBP family intramembrane metalloprotease n=1 Tax=Chengkuizengella axinellae TaxID=3064388 RepID=A0ABT9ITA2_9BACL|nr:CPBP family intramembrane glutamic endopeptidase [Chengkuizengella sp. 2205SS18-9]MDP5272589.1 CPBP family intramembrane metalloprotease [Chengkuizengella sp. 2205SS18-9]